MPYSAQSSLLFVLSVRACQRCVALWYSGLRPTSVHVPVKTSPSEYVDKVEYRNSEDLF